MKLGKQYNEWHTIWVKTWIGDKALIYSKTLNDKKSWRCCFVDLTKAFDSIQHKKKLLHKLVKAGINGKLYNIIRSIYSDIKSCVKVNGLFSEYFSLQVGLIITGDSHLPILFSFFINCLEK